VKSIEAAAHGKAVVSTPLGAEGLDFEDGKEILLASDVRELASHCVELLRDPGHAESIGTAARTRAIASYDRLAIRGQLSAMFARSLGQSGISSFKVLP
jgi:glycosyltransferase involved in cell wall biosynthesis